MGRGDQSDSGQDSRDMRDLSDNILRKGMRVVGINISSHRCERRGESNIVD
jgi:hypothetical protein